MTLSLWNATLLLSYVDSWTLMGVAFWGIFDCQKRHLSQKLRVKYEECDTTLPACSIPACSIGKFPSQSDPHLHQTVYSCKFTFDSLPPLSKCLTTPPKSADLLARSTVSGHFNISQT